MYKKKIRRIAILITLLVIGGGFWFMKFGEKPAENYRAALTQAPSAAVEGPAQTGAPRLEIAGPAPEAFAPFTLPSSGVSEWTVVCNDAYYVVLVFPRSVDYRADIRASVYNSAYPCEKGEKIRVALAHASINASAGEYYAVVADQGADGWYNPR